MMSFYAVAAKLSPLLGDLLGKDYLLIADEFEAYYIESDDSGSAPHRDSLSSHLYIDNNNMPMLVNVWIPLTDVGPYDSCMYVVPAGLDEHYPRYGNSRNTDNIADFDLQSIRAVPVKAGSIVCWSTSLIHWGGRNSQFSDEPRISFAMYFQSRKIPPCHQAFFNPGDKISFELKLYLAEKVDNDPLSIRYPLGIH